MSPGYQPPPSPRRPTGESFHLAAARRCYLDGSLTVEEFEASVAHVLAGGHLTAGGRIPELPTWPGRALAYEAGV